MEESIRRSKGKGREVRANLEEEEDDFEAEKEIERR